ncbi:hypothetical protein [Candidatus Microthrix parvicella]|uniref:hypothetical protein n=1 Tax=Candidatus Neomicrothrix parvicella TaxID=41950 RepID=UPI0003742189|nr:hypothetical protein [Candidatus Microthrix parvicella]
MTDPTGVKGRLNRVPVGGRYFVRWGWRSGWHQLAVRSSSAWTTVLAAFLVALAIAALAVIPGAVSERSARSVARTPGENAGAVAEPPLFRFQIVTTIDDDEPVTVVTLAGLSDDAPSPPGLVRFPRPGEVFVSPGLAERKTSDRWGPAAGVIQPEGLVSPNELFVYRGVEPESLVDTSQVAVLVDEGAVSDGHGFGNAASSNPGEGPDAVGIAIGWCVAIGALLMIPLMGVLISTMRLDADRRDRRTATLRIMGLSSRRIMTMQTAEQFPALGLGTAAAALTVLVCGRLLGPLGISGVSWYPSDVLGSPAALVLMGVFTLCTAATMAVAFAVTLVPAISNPLRARRNQRNVRRIGPRLLLLGLSVTGIIMFLALTSGTNKRGLAVIKELDEQRLLAVVLLIVLVGIGFLVGIPAVLTLVGRRLSRTSRRWSWQMAGSQLQANPSEVSRPVVSLVSLACWIALTQSLGLVITDILPYLNDAEPGQLITYGDLPTELDPALFRTQQADFTFASPTSQSFEVEPTIAFTTCRALATTGTTVPCADRDVFWTQPPEFFGIDPTGPSIALGPTGTIERPTKVLVDGRPASPNQKWITERSNIVAIMAPPELPPADMTLETAHILTLTDLSARTETAARAQIEQSAMKRDISSERLTNALYWRGQVLRPSALTAAKLLGFLLAAATVLITLRSTKTADHETRNGLSILGASPHQRSQPLRARWLVVSVVATSALFTTLLVDLAIDRVNFTPLGIEASSLALYLALFAFITLASWPNKRN